MRKIISVISALLFTTLVFSQPLDAIYYEAIKIDPAFPYYLTEWEFRQVGETEWKPAIVPGTIIDNFVDLSDWSNPSHPYYGENEKMYQWIGEKDWEFHTHLRINANSFANGTYEIYFEGLNTFTDVFINREKHESSTAFVPFRVTGLKSQELDIVIVFHSTFLRAKNYEGNSSPKLPGGERVYVRSPQYEFGWDWGPRFINMGITKPVRLIMHPGKETVIEDLGYVIRNKRTNKENVSFYLNGATNEDSIVLHSKLLLNGKSIDGFDSLWPHNISNTLLFSIDNPMVWWPNGSGESDYYELDLRFTRPGDTTTLAHKHFYYAHCDIKLLQEKDKSGESFSFNVNGKNIYAKGANYIPDDSFHPGKNTPELIRLAKEANMNMLRVWGGGIYPEDEFYIECLKNGIMVWQDFMFACAMYPAQSDSFNVREEAKFQYQRLNQFNNIALWCGNNENDEGWKNWGWQKELKHSESDSAKIWRDYVSLFDTIIPYSYSRFYKMHNYVSTSPKYGWGRKESMTHGDSHYWGAWWGLEPFEKYEEKVPRFMSEFGMQGIPQPFTLQKVIPASDMNFDSPIFKNHQKHPTGFKTLDHYLKEYLVIPDSMEDYIYATQILQAEAFVTGIEAQRRAKPYCMGSLIWQLNDCWPVTSWSIVDYDMKPKIAYDAVMEAFKPLIVSVGKTRYAYEIYVINDVQKSITGELKIRILDFYGNVQFEKLLTISCAGNSSKVYYKLSKSALKNLDLSTVYLNLAFMQTNAKEHEKTYWDFTNYHFVKLNELKLPPATIDFEHETYSYTLTSKMYCPYIILPSDTGWKYIEFLSADWAAGFDSMEKSIPWLDELMKDKSRIKTLNSLLKKH